MAENVIKFRVRRTADIRLAPTSPEGKQVVASLDPEKEYACQIRRPRSHKHHRKYWGLCRLVSKHHNELSSETAVDQVLKLLAGHFDVVQVGDHMLKIPKSISFSAMDQTEFNAYYERAVNLVCSELIPGVNRRDVEEEILRMAE